MSQEIRLVATNSDYKYIISDFENNFEVKYLLGEFNSEPNPTICLSAFESQSLGYSLKGSNVQDDRFIIFEKSVHIFLIPRPQLKGGVLYMFGGRGPLIEAHFGGSYKDECLVMGSFWITSQ